MPSFFTRGRKHPLVFNMCTQNEIVRLCLGWVKFFSLTVYFEISELIVGWPAEMFWQWLALLLVAFNARQ